MKKRKFTDFGEIDSQGKVTFYNRDHHLDFFRQHPGTRIEIKYQIHEESKDECAQMQRYYRAVIQPNLVQGLKNIGYIMNPDDAAEFIKPMTTVGVNVYDFKGKSIKQNRSTAEFDKYEWITFIDELIVIAAQDLGISIPEPNHNIVDLTNKK